jgi:excisionase family DNA binding protein
VSAQPYLDDPLYTIDQLAGLAGESRRTIERRIREGRIPVIRRTKRCVRIRKSDADNYLYGGLEPLGEGGTVHAFPTTQGGTA